MSRKASCALSPYWLTYRSKSREPGRPSSGKPSFLYSSWIRASIRIEMIIGFGRKYWEYFFIFSSHFCSSSSQGQEFCLFCSVGITGIEKSGRSGVGSGKKLKKSSRFSGISEMRDSPKPFTCFMTPNQKLSYSNFSIRNYWIRSFLNKTHSWITWVFPKL